ncbi:MAG: hypothetical protein ACM3OB_04610 [Acidobacteriota bacterium]
MSGEAEGAGRRRARRILPCRWTVAAVAVLLAAPAGGTSFSSFGFIALRGAAVESQRSWLAAGFGRELVGGRGPGDRATAALGQARLGVDWSLSPSFSARFLGVLRRDPPGGRGTAAGALEAFAQGLFALGDRGELRLRAGTFFLPTSRENVDPGWSSPYTISTSALNTWIGEEVRPTGVDLAVRRDLGTGGAWSLAGTGFGGNDSAGALLAWRGFAIGDRPTAIGEALPLPPLDSLTRQGPFGRQIRDGLMAETKPIGADLDGRLGWATRARVERSGRGLLQAALYDNRGDRRLHRGEYAWATRFLELGGELELGRGWRLLGEYARGRTSMGQRSAPHVDADLRTGYLMVSRGGERSRLSLRYERFALDDRDHSAAEDNRERGWAVTAAWLWTVREPWRLGVEARRLRAGRPAAVESGFPGDTDSWSLSLEARWQF